MPELRSPIVYYGGKYRVAPAIWSALGDVDHYIEPFAGSLATLLRRPQDHLRKKETGNDLDGMVTNFFRAVAADPRGIARFCDSPTNELDLTARHLWLVNTGQQRISRLEFDPDFYDVKVAGWWCWGICNWVGTGWCTGEGPWVIGDDKIIDIRENGNGNGHIRAERRGIKRQRPHLGYGQGINRPALSGTQRAENLIRYFEELADRLRPVRFLCGDWARLLTPGAMNVGHTIHSIGVFLDPPFSSDVRETGIYRNDSPRVSVAVRKWALAHGDDPKYRIVLAGYEKEHAAKMPKRWRVYDCGKGKRYGMVNETNHQRELLWLSPHCLPDHARNCE